MILMKNFLKKINKIIFVLLIFILSVQRFFPFRSNSVVNFFADYEENYFLANGIFFIVSPLAGHLSHKKVYFVLIFIGQDKENFILFFIHIIIIISSKPPPHENEQLSEQC